MREDLKKDFHTSVEKRLKKLVSQGTLELLVVEKDKKKINRLQDRTYEKNFLGEHIITLKQGVHLYSRKEWEFQEDSDAFLLKHWFIRNPLTHDVYNVALEFDMPSLGENEKKSVFEQYFMIEKLSTNYDLQRVSLYVSGKRGAVNLPAKEGRLIVPDEFVESRLVACRQEEWTFSGRPTKFTGSHGKLTGTSGYLEHDDKKDSLMSAFYSLIKE